MTTNREITYVIKVRNEAAAGLASFTKEMEKATKSAASSQVSDGAGSSSSRE